MPLRAALAGLQVREGIPKNKSSAQNGFSEPAPVGISDTGFASLRSREPDDCTMQNLKIYPRDEVLEQEALRLIAAWATRFTSLVSLSFPQAVLLEVAGSLVLFGGLDGLLKEVRDGLAELGYQVVLAAAPTPLAAVWLARAGEEAVVEHKAQLATVLGHIPLHCLQLNDKQLHSLNGMGLQNVADLVRLPRDGLTRRLGKEFMLKLDRAFGHAPDPQKPYVPPLRFHSRLLLPAEVNNIEALLFAFHRLLTELGGMLLGCGGGVQELSLQLLHRDRSVSSRERSEAEPASERPPSAGPVASSRRTLRHLHTTGHERRGIRRPRNPAPQFSSTKKDVTHIDFRLSALSRNVAHLMAVLRERLERVMLEAPVIEIVIVADTILPLGGHTQDLFTKQGESEHDWQSLLERLRARLGDDAVHGLRQVAEHRPELAWCYGPVGKDRANDELKFGRRPLWLLDEPMPLTTNSDDRPRFHGVLQLDLDRERIESGWWDDNDIARDYFVARNPRGLKLWVYRELRGEQRWFLHGIFG